MRSTLRWLRRYVVALIMVSAAVALGLAVVPSLEHHLSHSTVFTAVLVTAWCLGTGPAVFSAVFGYLATETIVLQSEWDISYLSASLPLYSILSAIIILLVRRDQADRARLEESQRSLMASEARSRATFENAAIGMVEVDAMGRFVAVNKCVCDMLGYSPDELLGMNVHDLTAPEDRERSDELNMRLRNGQSERFTCEKRYLRRDGSSLWVHVTASAIRGSDGSLTRGIGTVEDINERKQTEEALRASERRYRIVADHTFDWEFWLSPDGDFLYSSPSCLSITGYDVAAFREDPKLLARIIVPEDKAIYEAHLGSPHSVCASPEVEFRIEHRDGRIHWISHACKPLFDSATGEFLGMRGSNRDITERKLADAELAATRERAERARLEAENANAAKDQFLAVLSHELRTPLTPVLAALDLMQRDERTRHSRETLEIMRRNIALEARLIDDLLDVTRISRGKIVLDREAVDLSSVLLRVADICRPDIEMRRLSIHIDIETCKHRVYADPARLQQVFWNLLKNSIKFTSEGGHIDVSGTTRDDFVTIEIADNGIGIEPSALTRIFSAFEQENTRVARQFGGLGLGLAISKRLVEMQGGLITAHSEGTHRGATFRVVFPIYNEPFREAEAASVRSIVEPHHGRILLVEDHGDTAIMMGALLRSSGYEVTTAADVSEALKAADSENFDIMVSDLGLPDRSGLELMRELQARGSLVKGIAISGYGREEDVENSLTAGFLEHLTKPVDIDLLIRAVDRVSRRSASPRL